MPADKKEPVEIALSDKMKVVLTALDGWTSMMAERFAAAIVGDVSAEEMKVEYPVVLSKVYAIGSLTKINNQVVNPLANKIEFARVAKLLDFFETNKLMEEFMKLFEVPTEGKLKNS